MVIIMYLLNYTNLTIIINITYFIFVFFTIIKFLLDSVCSVREREKLKYIWIWDDIGSRMVYIIPTL